jgi:hypothetical protein
VCVVAPTCFGITLSSSGSVPSAFWEMLNWGAVDRNKQRGNESFLNQSKKNYKKPEGSLLCSQQPVTSPNPEADQRSAILPNDFVKTQSDMLPSIPVSFLVGFSQVFPSISLCISFSSSTTCLTRLILIDLIAINIWWLTDGEDCNSWSSSLYNFLKPHITLSFLYQIAFLAPCSRPQSACQRLLDLVIKND